MAAPRLTEGAIALITTDNDLDLKPTLQVTELKQVPTKQQNTASNDRYRLVLSDGTHTQQAMLATQINHLVKDGHLRSGSVVLLEQYQCAAVQGRKIIIVLLLRVIVEECPLIGNPTRNMSSPHAQMDQPRNMNSNLHPDSITPNNPSIPTPKLPFSMQSSGGSNQFHQNSYPSGYSPSTMNSIPKHEAASHPASSSAGSFYGNQNSASRSSRQEVTHAVSGAFSYPQQSTYKQPSPMYTNSGPVAKNEAAPRVIPIAALNPYQGRWTIKARVTAKGEMRHYNNPRGDGKVFAFDLLDAGRGEIRVTCFNAVADQFYSQIEVGRVYLISRGSLKPAQKNFNHLRNDLEIFLESQSVIQPCFDDDNSIPRQQFHFRPISDIEGMDSNAVVDAIGVVLSISPTTSIMRKNGTETQKRTLQMKDQSGRSVELTLWGNFCHSEGQRLQALCDAGTSPVLAVKSCRVNDFNGKAIGTISTSQLFVDPDFVEAAQLKEWFASEGRNAPAFSISKEASSIGRSEALKTISQIKDEKLGTSEKPDWISVNATVIFIKADNFCYTACPKVVGDRPCNKKVVNNGDGRWRCERCDLFMDDCDYRYILQFQIQDHTGLTWVTAFQESGEEIMGISAKELHNMKYESADDDGFSKILRQVLFTRFVLKLKVKEETFSDEQRVKSTVVKAERLNYSTHAASLLRQIHKLNAEDGTTTSDHWNSSNLGSRPFTGVESAPPVTQTARYGNQHGGRAPAADVSCTSCGSYGHTSATCPSVMSGPPKAAGECYKCHQLGHWARDCPQAHGNAGHPSGRFGGMSNQYVGGF